MFYYTLGNLRPELRSTHRAIQLVACVTAPNLKMYGFEAVLRPFIKDVETLNRVCMHNIVLLHEYILLWSVFFLFFFQDGLKIFKNGQQYTFRGTVFLVLADTQAAHQLGGYKEGVGFSLRKCRDCMATFNDMQPRYRVCCYHIAENF